MPVAVAGTAQLVTARTEDGRTVILAFSDEAALRRWRPDGSPWARVRRAELARAASEHRAAGVVIDVAGPSTVELMGEEIDALGREEA